MHAAAEFTSLIVHERLHAPFGASSLVALAYGFAVSFIGQCTWLHAATRHDAQNGMLAETQPK
jgi:hypothetical protein